MVLNWDDICDLQPAILSMAGPLTQYLNGFATPCYVMIRDIWMDVFELDWKGDISLLPKLPIEYCSTTQYYPFHLIKSRHMYEQCKMYLDMTTTMSYSNVYDLDHLPQRNVEIAHNLSAPMQNMWFDELKDVLMYPIALARAAIAGGHVHLLDYLVRTGGVDLTQLIHLQEQSLIMDVVAKNGHLEMIKYLHAAGSTACSTKAIDDAAGERHVHVIKWLHDNRLEGCTDQATYNAIANGHVKVLKYLKSTSLLKSHEFSLDQARGVAMLMFLNEECIPTCTPEAMDRAAAEGDLESVKYLHSHRTEGCTTKAMDLAAENGYLDVVEFLHDKRTEGCTTMAMDNAAIKGHWEIIKFLHEHRSEGCTTLAMDMAAQLGQLEIVQYLDENRSEGCTVHAMDSAAMNGHLEVVKYLFKNSTEGNTNTAMVYAAKHGYLEIVEFLQEYTTKDVSTKAMEMAIRFGHFNIVKYFVEKGMVQNQIMINLIKLAANNNRTKIAKFLRCKLSGTERDVPTRKRKHQSIRGAE